MWTERCEKSLLVGEEEFVTVGAANHRSFLSKNVGFEDIRRVFTHPITDEIFRLPKQELNGFTHYRPPKTTRW